jgi:UDP-N-acetylmuramoyl-tripeptide--D-alanyl-D-alanine ligase
MTNLQYFGYRFDRFLLHHTKPMWLIGYLITPVLLYYIGGNFFWLFFYALYIPTLFIWHKKLDRKLVLTARVKRFFTILIISQIALEAAYYINGYNQKKSILFGLFISLAFSHIIESIIHAGYKKKARRKLLTRPNLTVIALTASYGKTSIKEFLRQMLSPRFSVYATPGNVNTDLGICADINDKLPDETEIYIVESGARQKGDILAIAELTQPQYIIIGKIGKQHIEYFKTIENIQLTKKELLKSPRLEYAIVHSSAQAEPSEKLIILDDYQIKNTIATLEGTAWDLTIDGKTFHLQTPVLGGFNALNISLAFLLCRKLGVADESVIRQIALLKGAKHRLEPIKTPTKMILDDSYNGNLEGMLGACDLAATWRGRKVIVTPGIVESDEESNVALAEKINAVFDLALITGAQNAVLLCDRIDRAKRKRIFDKRSLETILAKETKTGDLILFANDAPSFI